jgi:hypothetical protein
MPIREILANEPTCPHCGHVDRLWYADEARDSGDTWETICPQCDKRYRVSFVLVQEFRTTPMNEDDET